MKKIRIIFVIVIVILNIIGCKVEVDNEVNDMYPFELQSNCDLDEVKNNNCIVHEDGDISYGQDIWDDFLSKINKNEPTFIRLAYYYTLGNPSQYSKELYEEKKDKYPVMYISDLNYDGEKYTLIDYSDGEGNIRIQNFDYIKMYEGRPSSASATFSRYLYYVLVNDDDVTWGDIEHGLFSAIAGDSIEHRKVYSKRTYKKDEKDDWDIGPRVCTR